MKKNMIIYTGLFICGVLFLLTAGNISTFGFSGDVLNQKDYVVVLSWVLIFISAAGIFREYLLIRNGDGAEKRANAEGLNGTDQAGTEQVVEQGLNSNVGMEAVVGHVPDSNVGTEQIVELLPDSNVEPNSRSKILIAMLLMFAFVLGFTYIGYYVTSLVFVFLITWLMFDWSRKKWMVSLLFSIGLNAVLYVLFSLINVYFPKTLLF